MAVTCYEYEVMHIKGSVLFFSFLHNHKLENMLLQIMVKTF